MKTVYVQRIMRIHLGRAGENLAQQVVWPGIVEEYEKLYGPGRFELAVQREGDAAPYPAVIEQGEKDVAWTITNADTAKVGEGSCELSYFVGEVLAKTQTWRTLTLPSLTGGEMAPPPEPEAAWVEMVLSARAAAEESRDAAEAAQQAAETAQNAAELARTAAETARTGAEAAETASRKIYGDIVELTNYTDEQMVETMAECGIIQPVGAGGESLYGASDLVYLF